MMSISIPVVLYLAHITLIQAGMLFFYSNKYLQNIQIQNDTTGNMELHSSPVAITHKQLKENIYAQMNN